MSFSILSSFCLNEYIMAEGAVFMSMIVEKRSTPELGKKIGDKWEHLWKKRDRALILYIMVFGTLELFMNVGNVLYIVLSG